MSCRANMMLLYRHYARSCQGRGVPFFYQIIFFRTVPYQLARQYLTWTPYWHGVEVKLTCLPFVFVCFFTPSLPGLLSPICPECLDYPHYDPRLPRLPSLPRLLLPSEILLFRSSTAILRILRRVIYPWKSPEHTLPMVYYTPQNSLNCSP